MQTNYEKKGNVFVGFIGVFIGAVSAPSYGFGGQAELYLRTGGPA